jgi:hypothetical protein
MCSLQLPESWHEACTTFCEFGVGRTFQTSSKISWRSAIRLAGHQQTPLHQGTHSVKHHPEPENRTGIGSLIRTRYYSLSPKFTLSRRSVGLRFSCKNLTSKCASLRVTCNRQRPLRSSSFSRKITPEDARPLGRVIFFRDDGPSLRHPGITGLV